MEPPRRILSLFRETLRRAQHIGGKRGEDLLTEARQFYRGQSDSKNTGRDFVAEAESRLSFLRMISKRYSGFQTSSLEHHQTIAMHTVKIDSSKTRQGGDSSWVLRDGKLVPNARAVQVRQGVISNWSGTNLDPDSVIACIIVNLTSITVNLKCIRIV